MGARRCISNNLKVYEPSNKNIHYNNDDDDDNDNDDDDEERWR